MDFIGDHLYEALEAYGDPMGAMGVIYMRFGKRMVTLWGHRGSFIYGMGNIWEPYGGQRGSFI